MAHNHADPKRAGSKCSGAHRSVDARAKAMGRPMLLVGLLLAGAVGVAVVYSVGRPVPEKSKPAPTPESAAPKLKTPSHASPSQPAPSQAIQSKNKTGQPVASPSAVQEAATQAGGAQTGATPVPENISSQLRAYLEPFLEDVKSAPDDPQKQAALGLVYAGNRMWGEARACFQRANVLDPTNYLQIYYEGICCAKIGNLDRAIELFYSSVELNADFAPASHRLGDALVQTGALDEAESAFRETLAVSPMAAPAYMGLAEVMLARGDYDEAVTNADTALGLRPGDPTAHYLLGMALRGQGRSDLAKRHLVLGAKNTKPYLADPWSSSLSAHCKIVDDQAASAMAKLRAGDVDGGIAELEALLQWYPHMNSLRNTLASAYRFAGAPEKSFSLLQESIAIDPTAPVTYIELAMHHLSQDQLAPALRAADQAIKISPTAYRAHEARGRILYKMGRDQDALAALEQAIEIHPASPRILLRAGLLSKSLGDLDAAKGFLERSIEHNTTSVLAYVALAEVHILQGDLGAAAQAEAVARAIFPNNEKVVLLGGALHRAIEKAEN